MATETEYALMAGRAYQTTRDPINQFPIPQGWFEFAHVPNNPDYPEFTGESGFEAANIRRILGDVPRIPSASGPAKVGAGAPPPS